MFNLITANRNTDRPEFRRQVKKVLKLLPLATGCSNKKCKGNFKQYEFHHFNPGVKFRAIHEMTHSSSFNKICDELSRCRVLCNVCHKYEHKNKKIWRRWHKYVNNRNSASGPTICLDSTVCL